MPENIVYPHCGQDPYDYVDIVGRTLFDDCGIPIMRAVFDRNFQNFTLKVE